MKHRLARRFGRLVSMRDLGLPGANRLAVAVIYSIVQQVVVLWLGMFLNSAGWNDLIAGEIVAGLSLRGFLLLTNAAVILFVIVDWWTFLTLQKQPRPLIGAYVCVLLVLCGMQYVIWASI